MPCRAWDLLRRGWNRGWPGDVIRIVEFVMSQREQPGGRWNDSLQQEPTNRPSRHLKPEQEIRRIRQGRPPGALLFDDCVGAMRYYEGTLQRDNDSYSAWMGLSYLFETLSDERRAGQCRGIARLLRRCEGVAATS